MTTNLSGKRVCFFCVEFIVTEMILMFVVVSEDKDASYESDRFTGTKDLYQT